MKPLPSDGLLRTLFGFTRRTVMFDRGDEKVCNLVRNSFIHRGRLFPRKPNGPKRCFHTVSLRFALLDLQEHASCHLIRFSVERDEPVGTFRIENLERGNMEDRILRKCGKVMK